MKYYIILLLAIALTGCKKEQTNQAVPQQDTQTVQQIAIDKVQGVRKFKGTVITSIRNQQWYFTPVDTQVLNNYEIEIYQRFPNTITLRSIDSTRPSITISEGLPPRFLPPAGCNECVSFGMDPRGSGSESFCDVTYNPDSDKVTYIHASIIRAYPGQDVIREEFGLTEQ